MMYHVTKTDPAVILSEGLTIDSSRGYWRDPASGFNPPAVYLYDALAHTRRVKPRSHVHLYEVNVSGLDLEADSWGGDGAWRSLQAIQPERITHLYTYKPFEKPLVQEPH